MKPVKEWFAQLNPETKQKTIKYGIISLLTVIVLGWYFLSGENEKRQQDQKEIQQGMTQEEALDNFDLMSDDVSQTFSNQFEQQNLAIDGAVDEVGEVKRDQNKLKKQMLQLITMLEDEKSKIPQNKQSDQPYMDMPSAQQQGYAPPTAFQENDVDIAPVVEIIGTIGRTQGMKFQAQKKRKSQERYFLPISFARAQTLHGMRLVTSEGAMANPEQLLIRIQAPSVLPNSIKADLEGCFIVASVTGHLAKQRVDPQLAYLSCLGKDGNAVIQEKVEGYVVDSDGNKGMSANIVSKMSEFIWRALLTGTVAGIGEGISLSGVQNSITGGGQVQTFDPDRISQSALGSGLKNGSQAIQDIFVDLAKQHAPVAEVGGAKKIMVIFQKGVWLNIKHRHQDGEDDIIPGD